MRLAILPAVFCVFPQITPAQSADPPRIRLPGEPAPLPPGVTAPPDRAAGDPAVTLPRPEGRVPVEVSNLVVIRAAAGWQVQSGKRVLREFGPDMAAADDARRVMRELVPTEWVAVGSPRPGVEYGLTSGKAAIGTPRPKYSLPVDANTARVEQFQGVWVLRDGAAVLANFGFVKADAEQALAAARRYGFNRVGYVGFPAPVFTYFYTAAASAEARPTGPPAALAQAAAVASLTRTGVPVPGSNAFVGERVVFDARKLDVHKDRADYVVAAGPDVLARFGPDEWAARDAAKLIQDARFTEACRVGGVSFYLAHGAAPTRVPFGAQATKFDPAALKQTPADGGVSLTDPAGRRLFTVPTAADADDLIRVLKGYGFDTVCQSGPGARAGVRFLAKTGR